MFGQVGGNLLIYNKNFGGVLVPHSGIFRASEIAAWHAMTCACFALLLVTLRKFNFLTFLSAAIIVALLIGIGILTGRRKTVIEVAVFASTYLILWFVLQKGVEKLGIALAIVGLVGFGWLAGQLNDRPVYVDQETLILLSLCRPNRNCVRGCSITRFTELGIAPIMWAYDSVWAIRCWVGGWVPGHTILRRGRGIAGAAEGGLGKITLELGIPGLLLMGWFAILVFNYLWRIMRGCIAGFSKDRQTFLWSFQFSRCQHSSVFGCDAGVWRHLHIANLKLDARLPFGSSGASRTRAANATAGDF